VSYLTVQVRRDEVVGAVADHELTVDDSYPGSRATATSASLDFIVNSSFGWDI
jgi:hypothetical protein